MRIKSKRLITLSFFAAAPLVLLVWLGRDHHREQPARDPGPLPVLDTDAEQLPSRDASSTRQVTRSPAPSSAPRFLRPIREPAAIWCLHRIIVRSPMDVWGKYSELFGSG